MRYLRILGETWRRLRTLRVDYYWRRWQRPYVEMNAAWGWIDACCGWLDIGVGWETAASRRWADDCDQRITSLLRDAARELQREARG